MSWSNHRQSQDEQIVNAKNVYEVVFGTIHESFPARIEAALEHAQKLEAHINPIVHQPLKF